MAHPDVLADVQVSVAFVVPQRSGSPGIQSDLSWYVRPAGSARTLPQTFLDLLAVDRLSQVSVTEGAVGSEGSEPRPASITMDVRDASDPVGTAVQTKAFLPMGAHARVRGLPGVTRVEFTAADHLSVDALMTSHEQGQVSDFIDAWNAAGARD